eukprot:m.160933 g.160933  ORF g.160933 m.160933 type:complete len:459 (+) comp16513_c0_seq4:77-1453(+)
MASTPLDSKDVHVVAFTEESEHDGSDADIYVTLLDATEVPIACPSKRKTTADEMKAAVMTKLQLPASSKDLWSIWVASQSLQLECLSHHKPLKMVRDWTELLRDYTELREPMEDPIIYLRKASLVHVGVEQEQTDEGVITMFFRELTYNVVYSLYPMDYDMAVQMAAIHLQLVAGNEAKKHDIDLIEGCLMPHHLKTLKNTLTRGWHRAILKARADGHLGALAPFALMQKYLALGRQCAIYGTTFFFGQVEQPDVAHRLWERPDMHVRVGISFDGVHIIDEDTNKTLLSLPYHNFTYNVYMDDDTGATCFFMEYDDLDEDGEAIRERVSVWSKQAELMDYLVTQYLPIVEQWQELVNERAKVQGLTIKTLKRGQGRHAKGHHKSDVSSVRKKSFFTFRRHRDEPGGARPVTAQPSLANAPASTHEASALHALADLDLSLAKEPSSTATASTETPVTLL